MKADGRGFSVLSAFDGFACLRLTQHASSAKRCRMVAIAPKEPVTRRKKGPGPNYTIPLPVRLRAKNLYVVQGLTPAVIAKQVKLSPEQVQRLVSREKWAPEKRRAAEKSEELALAHTREQLNEVIAAVGDLSEDASIAGLQRAVECTTKKSKFAAKDYASWANGARALVSIARQARGLEDKSFGPSNGAANTINLFVGRFGPAVDETPMKNVTPAKALDVAASPSAQSQ